MKQGDKLEITLGGYVVGYGILETIEDGKAHINIPQTNVIMGVATSLTDINEEKEVEVHTDIAEVEDSAAGYQDQSNLTAVRTADGSISYIDENGNTVDTQEPEVQEIESRNPGIKPEDISNEGIPADFDDDV